jgi:hypothetical protein
MAKSGKELRAAIEEAVAGGSVQPILTRKVEILRFEKRLLVAGKLPQGAGGRVTFLSLISVGIAVSKLRKLSGSLPCTVGRSAKTSPSL